MAVATDIAAGLDPVLLARRAGYEPDAWQALALRSTARRMLWNCCRQSGKSLVAGTLAVHQALYTRRSLVLVLSPSLRQSRELFRKALDVYQAAGDPLPPEAETTLTLELANHSRIVSLPGAEGTVRGYSGVALLIIDEAARIDDALIAAVRPMLAVSGGRLVALSTPFGKRGWFHKTWTEGEGWERVKITAEECPRISPAFLADERKALLPLEYASEYECEFAEIAGQVFAQDEIAAATDASIRPLFGGKLWLTT